MLVVANRLPVADGREEQFEALFQEQAALAAEQPGCEGVQLLRPVEGDDYVIQASWESRVAFERWQSSDAFRSAHADIPEDLISGSNRLEIYERLEESAGE